MGNPNPNITFNFFDANGEERNEFCLHEIALYVKERFGLATLHTARVRIYRQINSGRLIKVPYDFNGKIRPADVYKPCGGGMWYFSKYGVKKLLSASKIR